MKEKMDFFDIIVFLVGVILMTFIFSKQDILNKNGEIFLGILSFILIYNPLSKKYNW